MQSLHEQIRIELKKRYNEDEAFAWLSHPQQLLGLRIPARLMATGQGLLVLEALRRAQADRTCEVALGRQ
jgi:hypothetical protein